MKYLGLFVLMLVAVLLGLFAFDRYKSAQVAGSPAMNENTPESLARAAMIRDDFVRASGGAKLAFAEYMMSNGKPPTSNADVGLSAPTEYRGQSLIRMDLLSDRLVLTYDAKSAVADGRIELIADVTRVNTMGISWQCISPSFKDIQRILPGCRYSADGAVKAP
jgi:hypothetical protein